MVAILLLVTALQGSEVIEHNTQVKFAAEVRTPAGAQLLAGTGVRPGTMPHVRV